MPLTDTKCRTAKPRERTYKLTDGNGLYLEGRPNGATAWRYRFELDSSAGRKENVFAMGDYAAPVAGETPSTNASRCWSESSFQRSASCRSGQSRRR